MQVGSLNTANYFQTKQKETRQQAWTGQAEPLWGNTARSTSVLKINRLKSNTSLISDTANSDLVPSSLLPIVYATLCSHVPAIGTAYITASPEAK